MRIKNQIKVLALAVGMLLSTGVMAQQKIGHIDSDELIQAMPEAKAAQTTLEAYSAQLEKDLEDMQKELETKVNDYRTNEKLMTTLSRETKAQEIQGLQVRIQEYSVKAQEDLQQKQLELLKPIFDKATNAVKEVAKENGFTYIFDSSPSKAVVIFVDNGEDIMPLVKSKLGITQ